MGRNDDMDYLGAAGAVDPAAPKETMVGSDVAMPLFLLNSSLQIPSITVDQLACPECHASLASERIAQLWKDQDPHNPGARTASNQRYPPAMPSEPGDWSEHDHRNRFE